MGSTPAPPTSVPSTLHVWACLTWSCLSDRDIKPENMLYSDNTKSATIKLADFGLSVLVPKAALEAPDSHGSGSGGPLHEGVGSSYYVAPEVRDMAASDFPSARLAWASWY